MDFAKEYPGRDSMRMMRLLYRLGLGEQEKKHQQLVSFSKSVSNLQAKAREMKYQARLGTMERKNINNDGCNRSRVIITIIDFNIYISINCIIFEIYKKRIKKYI